MEEATREMIDVIDLYEDEDIVLTKATFKEGYITYVNTDIALKDSNGDIVKIKTIKTDFIN